MNITLITSVIDPPKLPLSYTNSRSVFSKKERFEQTKKTISSVRENIPDNKIFLIECSILSIEEKEYFISNVDIFLNIHDTGIETLINRMFTISKSMGEGTMTIFALKYLIENNIEFIRLFKLSGRYWLNNGFNYDLYNNILPCIHRINNDENNVFTCFYKLPREIVIKWLIYLLNSESDFVNCTGFEIIFGKFINSISNHEEIKSIESKVGIHGYVTVCGTFIDM
jgi:hypothetical protein